MSGLTGSVGAKSGIINEISAGNISGGVNFSELAGSIIPIGMSTVPTGYLLCDGAAVSRTVYIVLFTAIGTTWGAGDSSTTFNIPDLEGAFVRGSGTSTLFTQDSTITLAGAQDDSFQAHYHTWHGAKQQGGNSTHNNQMTTAQNGTTNQFTDTTLDQKAYSTDTTASGGTPRPTSETRPNNIGVRYCIKY